MFDQLERRPGDGLEDIRLFYHRFLEGAAYFLPHYRAALGVDYGHGHVIELPFDKIEPSLKGDPVRVRCHGYVLRLRHAALDFPVGAKCRI